MIVGFLALALIQPSVQVWDFFGRFILDAAKIVVRLLRKVTAHLSSIMFLAKQSKESREGISFSESVQKTQNGHTALPFTPNRI